MAIDPLLRKRLIDRLGLSQAQVYRRIAERARTLVLEPEQAAIALALEAGLKVSQFTEPGDLDTIRGAIAGQASQTVIAQPPARPTTKKTRAATRRAQPKKRRGKKVWVVHGRNSAIKNSMFQFLRTIGLTPIEWSEAVKATKKAVPYNREILDKAFKDAVAVVVLLTPDDVARLKPKFRKSSDASYESTLTGQARPNVLFEAGMSFGSHPDSTVIVEVGDPRPFSDISGLNVVRLTDLPESRQELVNRLEAAGCKTVTSGTDWYGAGTFAI